MAIENIGGVIERLETSEIVDENSNIKEVHA